MKKFTVYGPGCPKCKQAEELIRRLVAQSGLEIEVEKVGDLKTMIAAGVISTPAVSVNGELKVSGRVPKPEEIQKWLEE